MKGPSYEFDFCVNDLNGLPQGYIEAAEFSVDGESMIRLGAGCFPPVICSGGYSNTRSEKRFRVGRRQFPYLSSGSGGNWCWESLVVEKSVAVDLLNHMATLKWLSCDEAVESFFRWWRAPQRMKLTMEHLDLWLKFSEAI